MCDTLVATADVTIDGVTLFGKNSDREPNEAQYVCLLPALDHGDGAKVQCTYLKIPQVKKTHAVLLSKPFWMWGAEMGVNEFGLAVGNEAVFTKIPYLKSKGLSGMDLVRLALERGKTAKEAVGVITGLLETWGQGGNCGFTAPLFYHNSFILADPKQAWLLETAGRHWAARRIKGIYAISNRLTIDNSWDLASKDLVSNAIQKRWCKNESDFSFSRCYSDFLYTTFSYSRYRQNRAFDLLNAKKGKIQLSDITTILRDHGDLETDSWRPDRGIMRSTICNHAGFGPIRSSQTTGSMISHLSKNAPTHFVTCTAAPCTSIYKPIWIDIQVPEIEKKPSGTFDNDSLFWNHELLHRLTLNDYRSGIQAYRNQRDLMETEFFTMALDLASQKKEIRELFVSDVFKRSRKNELKWIALVRNTQSKKRSGLLHSTAWKKYNNRAGIPGIT